MIRIISLLLLLIVAATPTVSQPTSDDLADDEYSVYSSLINSRFVRDRSTKLAVISAHTQFDTTSVPIPKEFESDLLPKLTKPYALNRRFQLRVKYLLLTDAQLDRLINHDLINGWDAYWKTYPKATGLLTFSRVAFNATQTM